MSDEESIGSPAIGQSESSSIASILGSTLMTEGVAVEAAAVEAAARIGASCLGTTLVLLDTIPVDFNITSHC